jgi:outer membrane protein assembly factor BamB
VSQLTRTGARLRGARVRTGARHVAAWLPAVLLVPTAMVGSVLVSRPDDDRAAMEQVQPMALGTTWVFDVQDHGEPSGTRVRQVVGPSQLLHHGELREMVRLSSVYDDYPGVGPSRNEVYLGIEGKDLLQYGLVTGGQTLDVEPPAPAYRLPAEPGTSWEYDGLLGTNPLVFTSEVTDTGDVEVGGHTFTDCTEWRSTIEIQDPPEPGAVEILEEWTCPGIGTVRSTDIYAAEDVEITEELREFRSPDLNWSADTAAEADDASTTAAPERGPASAAGFDQQRSHAVPGTLGRTLAWTDSRDKVSGFARVSDDHTEVLAEQDGLVSARDVVTGESRWQLMLPPPIVASPAIAGDVVLVADAEKNVWALRLSDGSARWVRRFDDVVTTSPAVWEDAAAVADEDGSVSVLSLTDGEVLWTASLGGPAGAPPAVEGDTLVVGDESGTLTAFDLGSGEATWTASPQNGLDYGPTIGGDHVLAVDGDGVLSSYALSDGELQWQARGKAFPSEELTTTDREVVTIGDSTRVESFDLADGELNWSRRLREMDVPAAVVGEEVVAVDTLGRITVLGLDRGDVVDSWALPRPADGTELEVDLPLSVSGGALVVTAAVDAVDFEYTSYAYPVTGAAPRGVSFRAHHQMFSMPVNVPPVLDGGDIYAAGTDGTLYRGTGEGPPEVVVSGLDRVIGFDVEDGVIAVPRGKKVVGLSRRGEELWSFPTGEQFVGSLPVTEGGTAYLPLHGTGLAAVDLQTGEPRWATPLLGSTGTSSPAVLADGDIAYGAAGLMRLDGRTGAVEWQLGGRFQGATAFREIEVQDGVIYAVLTGLDPTSPSGERHDLVAVDAGSGELRWHRKLNGLLLNIGPAAGTEGVVVIDGTNLMTGFDPDTGKRRWTFQLRSRPGGQLAVRDGVVLLTERGRTEDLLQRDSRVVALDLETGAFLAGFEPPGSNDVFLPSVGTTPSGELLVPAVDATGQNVVVLEAERD